LTNIKNLYNGSHKLGGSANGRLQEPGTEELPGSPVERFYASLRFEKREKLDELLQEKGDNSPI
jgi:hypothetical protein